MRQFLETVFPLFRSAFSKVVRARVLRLGLGAAANLIAFVAIISFAAAGDSVQAGAIVALAYDARTDTLLKAEVQGLYRSGDDGRSWEPVPIGAADGEGSIAEVAVAAGKGTIYVAGPGIGVLRSDGEDNWASAGEGLPSRDVAAFATHSTQPETIYAYLPDSGIYRSQDSGKSWRLMDKGPEGIRELIHTDLKGSMETGWLYAATAQGVRISMDCFCLWRDAVGVPAQVEAIAFQLGKPERLYAASLQGLFRSESGGREWQQASAPDAAVTALTVTPSGIVFAASRGGELFKSSDGAKTWERVGA